MEKIAARISHLLTEEDAVFVFPTEVATDFWRQKAIELSPGAAVLWQRFLSWDKFKETIMLTDAKRRPVSQSLRRFFAAWLTEDKDFTLPGEPDRRASGQNRIKFAPRISRTLAGLPWLREKQKRLKINLPARLAGELKDLSDRYAHFLEERELFDPAWQMPRQLIDHRKPVIFFPELLDDFERYRDCLNQKGALAVSGPKVRAKPELRCFDTALEEGRDLAGRIRDLLDAATPLDQIVVTLANPAGRRLIREQAALLDLPLAFHHGQKLADLPGGRFYALAEQVAVSGFSHASLKALLLNRAFPWAEPQISRRLLAFGVEHGCPGNAGADRSGRFWQKALRRAQAPPDLQKFYSDLDLCARKLAEASTFFDLRQAEQIFIERFFDPEAWDADQVKVFRQCQSLLNEMCDLEKQHALAVARPLSLFRQELEQHIYVTRHNQPGIAVYDFRVAAGIFPEHHLIAFIGQEAVRVENRRFDFLPETARQLLGPPQSLTADFLNSYAFSGVRTRFSASRQASWGPNLYPLFFKPLKAGPSSRSPHPLERETEYWLNPNQRPAVGFTRLQQAGFKAALTTIFTPKNLSMTSAALGDASTKDRAQVLRSDTGRLKVSPTVFDSWNACPFAFFFTSVLKIPRQDFTAKWENSRLLGVLRHQILKDFFSSLQANNEIFYAANLPDYQKRLTEAAATLLSRWQAVSVIGGSPFWPAFRQRLLNDCLDLLRTESQIFDGFRVRELESSHQKDLAELGCVASGRLDRVAANQSALWIIDYKSSLSTAFETLIDKKSGHPHSWQLPLYLLILPNPDHLTLNAGYYDIKKSRFLSLVGGKKAKITTEEQKDALRQATLEKISAFADTVNRGDFRPPDQCRPCYLRGLCRVKYLIRLKEDG